MKSKPPPTSTTKPRPKPIVFKTVTVNPASKELMFPTKEHFFEANLEVGTGLFLDGNKLTVDSSTVFEASTATDETLGVVLGTTVVGGITINEDGTMSVNEQTFTETEVTTNEETSLNTTDDDNNVVYTTDTSYHVCEIDLYLYNDLGLVHTLGTFVVKTDEDGLITSATKVTWETIYTWSENSTFSYETPSVNITDTSTDDVKQFKVDLVLSTNNDNTKSKMKLTTENI